MKIKCTFENKNVKIKNDCIFGEKKNVIVLDFVRFLKQWKSSCAF
jgi:hypothetical protein